MYVTVDVPLKVRKRQKMFLLYDSMLLARLVHRDIVLTNCPCNTRVYSIDTFFHDGMKNSIDYKQ